MERYLRFANTALLFCILILLISIYFKMPQNSAYRVRGGIPVQVTNTPIEVEIVR